MKGLGAYMGRLRIKISVLERHLQSAPTDEALQSELQSIQQELAEAIHLYDQIPEREAPPPKLSGAELQAREAELQEVVQRLAALPPRQRDLRNDEDPEVMENANRLLKAEQGLKQIEKMRRIMAREAGHNFSDE